ncbi:MAG: extracellular solute-binding protein, partial [Treponema sp.]|nr:extracellular solute-binding protein [Treponema sp.]
MKDYLKIGAMVAVLIAVAFAVEYSFSAKKGKSGNINIEIAYSPAFGEAGAPPANWTVYDIVSDKLGINLSLTALPSKAAEQDKIILAAAKNDSLPDFFTVSGTALNQLIEMDMVSPVDDMYALMPQRSLLLYGMEARNSYQHNGKHYALSQTGAIARNEGVLIRKDWLDALNLPVPVTTEDFLNVMRAFTYGDPDKDGRQDTYGYGAYLELRKNEEGLGTRFQPLFGAFGVEGTFDMNAKTAGLNIYKNDYYDALDFVRRMVSEKVIDPNWTVYNKNDFRDAWKRGAFGIMREQNAALALENNYSAFDEKFPEGEWIVVNPPVGPKAYSSVGVYTNSGHRIFAVSKKARESGKIKKIAQLLEWMSSNEGYMLLGFGVKGVNYLLDAEGNVTTEGLLNPEKAYSKKEMAPILQLRNLVFYNSDIELAGRYPTWTTKNGRKMSALKYLREMQSKKWTQNFGGDGIPSPSDELKKFYEQGVL